MAHTPTTGLCSSLTARRGRGAHLAMAGMLLLAASVVTPVAAAGNEKDALAGLVPVADSLPAANGPWLRLSQPPPGVLAAGWHRSSTITGPLLTVGVPAGRLGQLHWQVPLASPSALGLDNTPRQMRVSLVLTASDPYADLRLGMLTRVELSGQTTLSLRPRGGGKVMLHLTSRW